MTQAQVGSNQEQPIETTATGRLVALYVLCLSVLMIVLDVTVVNVALPSIQDDLGLLAVEPRVGRQRLPDRRSAACCCSPGGSAT